MPQEQKSTVDAEALGQGRGGCTKVHVRVDRKRRPFTFGLTPSQQHDVTMTERLIQQGAIRAEKCGRPRLRSKRLVADKAYSSRNSSISSADGVSNPSSRVNATRNADTHNTILCRERNIVERFIYRLKHFREMATRYDKRATTYLATVLITSIVLCIR